MKETLRQLSKEMASFENNLSEVKGSLRSLIKKVEVGLKPEPQCPQEFKDGFNCAWALLKQDLNDLMFIMEGKDPEIFSKFNTRLKEELDKQIKETLV